MSSTTTTSKVLVAVTLLFLVDLVTGCLITNCPRGGKRSGSKYGELGEIGNVKQCISCGPGGAGQCFGPRTCCGPFGCLLGTPETVRCRRDGMFHDSEPCIAGSMNCRKNSGRCAAEGLCCSQDSCFADRGCLMQDAKNKLVGEDLSNTFELINLLGYRPEDVGLIK